jgi:hypothetical protein
MSPRHAAEAEERRGLVRGRVVGFAHVATV